MLGLTAAVAIAGSMIARMLFDHIVDQDLFKRRVLVYGAGRRAASLLELRRRSDQRGFRIVGFIRTEGDDTGTPVERTLPRPDDLYSWVTRNPIDEIVVAMDDRRRGFPMHEFLECRLAGIDIIELPSFLERETGKVRLDVLNPSWIIFGEGFRASQVERWLERGFDLVAGCVLLMLALPIMFATAIAIMIEDGWKAPVLYRQRRVGQHGHVFDVLKFRSMSVDAERTGAAWAVKDDPRVTRVGALIRKTRIDELPQLGNVLRGEMSFVGPRPERPEFVEQFRREIPGYMQKHLVKAGITGWAQVNDLRGDSDLPQRINYDLYYIEHWSIWFDLRILALTLWHILTSRNAY